MTKYINVPDTLEIGELFIDTLDGQIYTRNIDGDIIKVSVGQFVSHGGETFNDYDNNQANGIHSHAEGRNTIANNPGEHAEGLYNISRVGADGTVHTIGIGSSENDRENAVEVHLNGDTFIKGVGGFDGKNIDHTKSIQQVIHDLENTLGIEQNDKENINKIPDIINDVNILKHQIGDRIEYPDISITQQLGKLEGMISDKISGICSGDNSPIVTTITDGVVSLELNVDKSLKISNNILYVNNIDNGNF